ncbi:LUD domain-containing protein [Halorussus amylolyticus]|uniref:LUD domain-containing protein n=1 Tax=Halorussus amylolyticus TaxID=1126242 RepID=UPI00104422CA|nr:LUD domain-containing protein [Halorussus amylolyticus]
MTSLVGRFECEAADAGCEVRRTLAADFADALAESVERPAVGAPLPFTSVSLPEYVTTDPTPSDLDAAATGITPAQFAVAEYGSVAIRSTGGSDEAASLYPERHVAVLAESDVVGDMTAGIERMGKIVRAGGDAVFATGASATADMGELVVGAHGPREVTVVVVEDR